jgi:hypothetical protein
MAELGWYAGDKNRVATIKPSLNEEFFGKLIGVADFGLSNEDHTVVLEVISPDSSTKPPYYLTFNRAKGINRGTGEAQNQVTIVQGRAGETSLLRYKIKPGSRMSIPDYHDGRSLDIGVGFAMSESFVDYVLISVVLSRDPSLMASSVPSVSVTAVPSIEVSNAPSVTFSLQPSLMASSAPSVTVTAVPSIQASHAPSATVSLQPSLMASSAPSVTVTAVPSVEASDAPSVDASLQPSVDASSAPSVTVTAVPSIEASNAPSATVSFQPSFKADNLTKAEFHTEFLIKTVYEAYSTMSEWCVTAENKLIDSKIYVRPCKDYNLRSENLQLWESHGNGHIKLAGPAQDEYCITSLSQSLVIKDCENDVKAQVFDLNESEGTVTQTKANGEALFIGIDNVNIFAKLRLFPGGSIDAELTTWRLKHGNAD